MKSVAYDGRTELTTHPLFDEKGPRTMLLDPASAATINGIKLALISAFAVIVVLAILNPYMLVVPLAVIAQPKLRQRAKRAITAWLDRAAIGGQ